MILGSECDVCGSEGRPFSISKPGDIRPCLGKSVDLLESLFSKYFGISGVLKGRTVFLNKTAGEDRTDEVIFQGRSIGVIRYDIRKGGFTLDLKLDGALIIAGLASKGIVRIEHGTGHLKGKNIPGHAIIENGVHFEAGDPLIVLTGGLVCSAVAKVDSKDAANAEKAIGIRDVGKGAIELSHKRSSWTGFVNVNQKHFRSLESKGVSDIRSFIRNNDLPVTLSFSGGKDSLACFGLASRATEDLTLLFINTGLEFPETIRYVHEFARKNHQTLFEAEAGREFWDQVETFGPPAKDFRWCCKVCKLAPLTNMIESKFPKGTITIEGNRSYESFSRSNIGFVEKNPFVPNQVTLNPIKDWRAVDVWGYIWWRNLDYNNLYEEDFERIGCYLCPSCLESEWHNTKELHPELFSKWDEHLKKWARDNGADDTFVQYGFWRWKVFPPKMVRIAEELHLEVPKVRSDRMDLKWVKGVSSCTTGGYSAEGVLSVPRKKDFSKVVEALKTIGNVRSSLDYEIALVKTKNATLKIFGGGQIIATGPTPEITESIFEEGAKAILKAQMCTQCGICVRNCRNKAITLDGGLVVSSERCSHCGRCTDACVVAHYYDKLVT